MFGLITRMSAVNGKRDELITILLAGAANMPDCQLHRGEGQQ
jgi:hypothetical protein